MKDKDIKFNIGFFDPEGKNPNPLNNKPFSDTYKNLAKFWSNLPSYPMMQKLVNSIINNDVILIISQTGTGKSVNVPKACLHITDYKGNVVMTLPKRLITLKAAEFSAKTLDVELGEHVGYAFRGDNRKTKETVLLYCTDGTIVAMLKTDPTLINVDILIIDEAHERKVQIDLLLYLIKNAINIRKKEKLKPLKLVIMSATINETIFNKYFKSFSYDYMFLSGLPNYPIESIYLENALNINNNQYLQEGKNIILNIVKNINSNNEKFPNGDILFFVCTVSECEQLTLELNKMLSDSFVMALYSNFDTELEQYISNPVKFKELNKKFARRIFISTNVAESSLTIDGISYVIDSGLELSVKYDANKKINVMNKNFITKAQMAQRKGRAGRTKAGICYHLYTPEQEESTNEFPEPEILREDLKNVFLSLMKLGCQINKKDFTVDETIDMFSNFIEPPHKNFIKDAVDFANSYNLISDNTLSKTGKMIVESRLDITDALSLLYAWNVSPVIFKTVFKIICIQSYLKKGIDDFFYDDIEVNVKKKLITKLSNDCNHSEHILMYNIFKYIKEHKDTGFFNIELFDKISKLYDNQINKITHIFNKYNITIENMHVKKTNVNIICAFNYGFKFNRAFKNNNCFKFNNYICDLSKCLFKYDKFSSIIFFSNLLINNKLNISIVSPWLLSSDS